MATLESGQYICNDCNQPKPKYEVRVSGNWTVHDRRRRRASRFSKNTLISAIAIVFFSLVLLLGFIFILLLKERAHFSLTREIVNRIKLLETRVTFLESSIGGSQTDHSLRRLKRAAEPIYLEEEKRGKKRNKSNRTRKIDIPVVQFTSSNPGLFAVRPLQGVIGPWYEEFSNLRKMGSFGLKLVESDRKVKISHSGIYFIYSQITYPSRNSSSSYSINLISDDDQTNTPIAICSAPGELLPYSEVSCYTSIVRSLKPGDIIYLQQIEQSRNINMENSSTYFGIILLSGL